MKHKTKIPIIIKINEIRGMKISVRFSTGQDRILDFERIVKGKMNNYPNSIRHELMDPTEFKKVRLTNHTLCWDNISTEVKLKNGDIVKMPLGIGADVLFKFSTPDLKRENIEIGPMLKALRIKEGKTQDEVAILSGTSRTYISRIENQKSDIELFTLEKIVKAGLNRELKISFI
jgi:DNA-binding XRE family transcriptional regulator